MLMYSPDDGYFLKRARFEHCISWWPRRCSNSHRWIWGYAVRGRMIIFGPGEPVAEDRWYHRHEAAIILLKGGLHGTA